MPERLLVVGCGFLGSTLADLASSCGLEVEAWTCSPESAASFACKPFRVRGCDICDAELTKEAATEFGPGVIIDCVSSGRGGADEYHAVYLEGARNLIAAAPHARLIFTGSTSVYAQTEGTVVDEASPANPDRETGRILRETEDLVLASGGIVARLAGLYGPGRSVLVRKLLDGTAALEDGGERFINQIHRDDAATALLRLADRSTPPGIYNVCDDTPLTQREVYTWLAEHFGRPIPPCAPKDPSRKRGWTNKRVSNAKLRSLGWSPRYTSFRDAVTAGAV